MSKFLENLVSQVSELGSFKEQENYLPGTDVVKETYFMDQDTKAEIIGTPEHIIAITFREERQTMPRNMITRIVKSLQVTCKLIDKETDKVVTEKILLERKPYKEGDADKSLARAVKKQLPDSKMLISIESVKQVDRCYGMSVEKFISSAEELDLEKRQPIAQK